MPPQVRTSFIPKKPIQQTNTVRASSGVGIFFAIALVIFLGSVLLGGGAFAYEQYLGQSVKSKSESLARAKAAFEPATIQDLMRLDKRLKEARKIIEGHKAPSGVFALLSNTTLSTVAFDKFDFSTAVDGKGVLQLHGVTNTFSDVALQSDAFNKERLYKDVLFSGFTVAKTGGVEFAINAVIDPTVIAYGNTMNAGDAAPQETTAPTAPSAPSTTTPIKP